MIRLYKAVRAFVVTTLIVVIGVPLASYVVLSTPWAQNRIRDIAETELAKLLDTDVAIDRLHIYPFNRIVIEDITVADDFGKTAVSVDEIAARFELAHFLRTGRFIIDYAAIEGLDGKVYRQTPESPLNIAGIIDKLKSKDTKKEKKRISLDINTIKITGSSLSYDVLNADTISGRFDRNHIKASDLNLMAYLSISGSDSIMVDLEHLSFREKCGLALDELKTSVEYTPTSLSVNGLSVLFPDSRIHLGDLRLTYNDPAELSESLKKSDLSFSILRNSYVTPSDFQCFLPGLSALSHRYNLALDAHGNIGSVDIESLNVTDAAGSGLKIELNGNLGNLDKIKDLTFNKISIKAEADARSINSILSLLPANLQKNLNSKLLSLGNVSVSVNASGSLAEGSGTLDFRSTIGEISADAAYKRRSASDIFIDGTASVQSFDLGKFLSSSELGTLTASVVVDGEVRNKIPVGNADLTVENLNIKGVDYSNITAHGLFNADRTFNGDIDMDNSLGRINAFFSGCSDKDSPNLKIHSSLHSVDLNALGLIKGYERHRLSANIESDLTGSYREWIDGYLDISGLTFTSPEGKSLNLKEFRIEASNITNPNHITVRSDLINGQMEGELSLFNLAPQCADIISHIIPAFVDPVSHELALNSSFSGKYSHDRQDALVARDKANNFTFSFEIAQAENFSKFFNLPVQIVYPVSIDGIMDYDSHMMGLTIDAPYLQQGEKIIDNTVLQVKINGKTEKADIYATSNIPTQKGNMSLVTAMTASNNEIETRIDWNIEREKTINGQLSFSTLLGRTENRDFTAMVRFNPGDVNFGNSTWKIAPATISWAPKHLNVDGFHLSSDNQSITISGTASDRQGSGLEVSLKNIELVSIFETLDINNALIGGTATGRFHARELFGQEPRIWCDNLHVKNIGYNYCTLGDGDVAAHWDNEQKSFYLDAKITEPGGKESHIWGNIFATKSALDINFDADHVKVGFLKPFMAAFADDVTGYASGRAHLFGTFKDIDLTGDLYADNVGLKIGFTNTWYYATDSVHIAPGEIKLNNISIRDALGNKARLNGYLKHTYFHFPVFDFRVTDAVNFLSYDVNAKQSPDWYGKVFGNGSAFITGRPGVVNIDVNMATAEGSTFTFVLSDALEADEYTFITFRDPSKGIVRDSIIEVEALPKAVREYRDRERAKALAADEPSAYNMNIQMEITPQAKIVLVMDPIGGDEIKSWGTGNLRMTYASRGNDLHMYGNYTIDRGSYNFTLQDIIVKDFTIKEGSSISFTGDPYAARLDINAIYQVNANLSDLDESFLQDKELNRTNVPVHAVLKASGDMRQPDIAFDLEFPTLQSDVYRKVRSIVSTEEMMNRQIIYLLALNRFYTPDYMSTTKGNELFSVASSTISSQLSSMLGKLSENWSIAPNLRSDRGDFSDVEVDVALTSNLLNNRLRLNGNFGYRDKSLNTNQFIGDFDAEYLLNRKGTWRLKAYNRYNDQNYYLRTAQTTQGFGIMFKRDFDKMFNFLRPRKRKPSDKADDADTIVLPPEGSVINPPVEIPDTIK